MKFIDLNLEQNVNQPGGKTVEHYLNKKSTDNSNAGYSIKKHKDGKYTIGNSEILFHDNKIEILDKEYKVDGIGLLELLTKKTPNMSVITQKDLNDYKQILQDTNAIYKGFVPGSNSFNTNNSEKWRLIKTLFPDLLSSTRGRRCKRSESPAHSEQDETIESLEVSIQRYCHGRVSEYNNIIRLLTKLLRLGKIDEMEYMTLYDDVKSFKL